METDNTKDKDKITKPKVKKQKRDEDKSSTSKDKSSEDMSKVDTMVLQYLRSRGYRNAEETLKREAKTKSLKDLQEELAHGTGKEQSLPDFILFYNETEANNPDAYEQSYSKLKKWMEDSLDLYKSELREVLWPIFFNVYFDLVQKNAPDQAKRFFSSFRGDHIEQHTAELNRMEGIISPQHLEKNPFVTSLRINRYVVKMSRYGFELLLSFLQDNKFMMLLRIINQFINLHVVKEGVEPSDESIRGNLGIPENQISTMNEQPVKLGKPEMDPLISQEIERQLKDQPDLMKIYQDTKSENSADAPPKSAIPLPSAKIIDAATEIKAIEDISKRVSLAPPALPSICCYTFHNTYNSINTLSFNNDCTMIAGGSSESFVRVWSLIGENLRALDTRIESQSGLDHKIKREKEGEPSKRLVGHSGPVYSTSFSPDNKYLISCSEDQTVRLWSMDTFTNLVRYKGHNYPVWDVDFASTGFYFATASHDRTARLWSCDQIHPLRIFVGHLSDVDSVKFHPNCNYVLTGSADRSVRMWDIQRGACVRLFPNQGGTIYALAISPDGRTLACGGEDKVIRLWDLGSGKLIKSMKGHTDVVYSLDFSHDGQVLGSGSIDGTVRIWNPNTNGTSGNDKENRSDLLGSFPTKKTPIYTVKFTRRNVLTVAGTYEAEF